VLGQVPIYYNHRNTGRPPDANNKFTSKYLDVPVTPRYPFGFGLSYTTFAYSDLKVSAARARVSDTVTATVTVANTGKREGTEVVQLYVRDEVASVSPRVRELKAFQRVTLKPGESRPVSLRVAVRDLWFIGLDMKPVVEPGMFRVYVGPSSAEGLETSFECIP
jgi:beta-glucosidase